MRTTAFVTLVILLAYHAMEHNAPAAMKEWFLLMIFALRSAQSAGSITPKRRVVWSVLAWSLTDALSVFMMS